VSVLLLLRHGSNCRYSSLLLLLLLLLLLSVFYGAALYENHLGLSLSWPFFLFGIT